MVQTIGAAATLQSRLCRASSPYAGEPLRFPWGCAEREIYVLFWAAIVGAGVPDSPCEGRAEAGGGHLIRLAAPSTFPSRGRLEREQASALRRDRNSAVGATLAVALVGQGRKPEEAGDRKGRPYKHSNSQDDS